MTWQNMFAFPAQDLCGSLSAKWRDYVTDDSVRGREPKIKGCALLEEESKILPLSCCQDRLKTEWNLQNQLDKCRLVLSGKLILIGRLALEHAIQAVISASGGTKPNCGSVHFSVLRPSAPTFSRFFFFSLIAEQKTQHKASR